MRVYMNGVDDFLTGIEAEDAAEVIETPQAEPEAVVEQETPAPVRDEKGRFVTKGEVQADNAEPATPPVAEETNGIPLKALQEERRKRQELEARLEQLLAQPPAPPAPLPSVFEDEDSYTQAIVARAVEAARANLIPELQTQARAERIEEKRALYAETKPDFTELETQLFEEMQSNAALAQQVMGAKDPVEFGYRYMKNKAEVAQLGSLDLEALKATLREQIKAEMAPATPAPVIPTSLAGEQSSSAADVPPPVLSLDQILGRKPL